MEINEERKIESLLSMAVNVILYNDSYYKTLVNQDNGEIKDNLGERGEDFQKILIDILENDYPEISYLNYSNKFIINFEPEVELSIYEKKSGDLSEVRCRVSIMITKESRLPLDEIEFIVNKLNQNSELSYRLENNGRDILISREEKILDSGSLIAGANYIIQLICLLHSTLVDEIKERDDIKESLNIQPSEIITKSRNLLWDESITVNDIIDEIIYLKNFLIPKKFKHFFQYKKINSNIVEIYMPLRKDNIVCKQTVGLVLNPSNYRNEGMLIVTELKNDLTDLKKSREFVAKLNSGSGNNTNLNREAVGSWITTDDKDLAIIYKIYIPNLVIKNTQLSEIILKSIREIIYGNEELEIEKKFLRAKNSVNII